MSDTATPTQTDEALNAARWNLEPLVDDGWPDRALAQLAEAQEKAEAFAERYRGTLAEIDAPGLAEAMRELEAISDLAGRAGTYASLKFSVVPVLPAIGLPIAAAWPVPVDTTRSSVAFSTPTCSAGKARRTCPRGSRS